MHTYIHTYIHTYLLLVHLPPLLGGGLGQGGRQVLQLLVRQYLFGLDVKDSLTASTAASYIKYIHTLILKNNKTNNWVSTYIHNYIYT